MKKGEKYTLSNGLKMIVGELFNWEISPIYFDTEEPFVYNICTGSIGDKYSANYYHEQKKLRISRSYPSSDSVLTFYCETLEDAEKIIKHLIDGMEIEVYPIHKI